MDRRTAIKWMLAALGGLQSAGLQAAGLPGAGVGSATISAGSVAGAASAADDAVSIGEPTGYGKDPDLLRSYQPGELWPLVMSPQQRSACRVLADFILPAEGAAPSASALGVHDFLNEWVSAPYEPCRADADIILGGLDALAASAQSEYGQALTALSGDRLGQLCRSMAEPGAHADFFARFRKLVTIGYFTTAPGMEALGYVGNRPLASFEGPPVEALRKAGVKV